MTCRLDACPHDVQRIVWAHYVATSLGTVSILRYVPPRTSKHLCEALVQVAHAVWPLGSSYDPRACLPDVLLPLRDPAVRSREEWVRALDLADHSGTHARRVLGYVFT